jgi:uncharacterized protein DUF3152
MSTLTRRRVRQLVPGLALVAAFAVAFLAAAGLPQFGAAPTRRSTGPRAAETPAPAASPSLVVANPAVPTAYPHTGPGTWRYADGTGPVVGTGGPLRRYRVAVETGVPYDVARFAADVGRILGDPRGWTGGGTVRLQQVAGPADFTVYLATEGTSAAMCRSGGLDTGGYTSCRLPGQVIINLDRWFDAVPEFVRAGVPLDTYRAYLVNHETGHQLGYGHELCPGAGRPAPVMEQQTLGLHGCTANPWPYPAGQWYAGPPGEY